jgi:anti-sigma regulatory factor (Ser/Thr protein kinase)
MPTAYPAEPDLFRHEALFYRGENGFVEGTLPFITDGILAGEAVLAVISVRKIDLLRSRLGDDAGRVTFADMDQVGTNPARIIPAWRDFVDAHVGMGLRGIGEPIWAARSADELVECQRHESLLNLVFAGTRAFTLRCPYDVEVLDDSVLEEARRSHPILVEDGGSLPSDDVRTLHAIQAPFDRAMPDPPPTAAVLDLEGRSLLAARHFVRAWAAAEGLGRERTDDLVTAVNEVVANAHGHGGPGRTLRIWPNHQAVVCEVRDSGTMDLPMAGRVRPETMQPGGRGLWLANQLCELVQLRATPDGTAVRLHLRRT